VVDAGKAPAADADLSADLEQARRGDEAAFTRIFRAVHPGLVRYLSALVGADAEDVASEAWGQACRDLSRFRGDIDGFRGWIATIGRHRAIDQLRAKARRPVASTGLAGADSDQLATTGGAVASAEGLALENMSTRAAVAAIAALPREQAEAVLLRAVLGLDAAAAGRVMGKRAGAVRTAAYRGLRSLAAQLDALGIDQLHDTVKQPAGDIFGAPDAEEMR
jgi:RNA polymerase sigma-70 factor (ECF subfamily)